MDMFNYGVPNYGYGNLWQNPITTPTGSNGQQIIRVHGKDGAKAFPLNPNSSVLMMDETDAVVWAKVTDGAGFPTLKGFKIVPIEEDASEEKKSEEPNEYVNKSDFSALVGQLNNLEDRFNSLAKELGND